MDSFFNIESTKQQDITKIESLALKCHNLYMDEYGCYDNISISPTMHRVLHHTVEYMQHFQAKGLTLGDISEQAIEATNKDSKHDILKHGYHGSYEQNNLNCF